MFVVRVFTVLLLFGILSEGACIRRSYDLSVTDVTATSAVLHWKIGNKARKRSRDREVHCAGVRHYTQVDGTPVTDTDKVVRFAPRRLDHHFLGNLLPNFRYSCIVVEEADKSRRRDGDVSRPLLFSTHYKAPETPKAPLIHTGNADSSNLDHDLRVDLFATSSKYGPISGYKVQFHLVDGSPSYVNGLPRILPEFLKPFGPLAPLEEAQNAPQPLSFCISYDALPGNISVGDDLLGSALKGGAVYTVVTVAYTRMADNSQNILFSASNPSQPFTAEDHVPHHQAERVGGRRTRNLAVILGVGLPSVIVVYVSLVGAFIGHREFQMAKHRKSSMRNKKRPKKRSSGPASSVPLKVIVPHAFDIEHSHSHMGHHDHSERKKGRPMGAPVLPRHPTAISLPSSLSFMRSTSSDSCAVDIDGLSGQHNVQGFPSLPRFMAPSILPRSATNTVSPPFIISESISKQTSEASTQSKVSSTSVACRSTVPPMDDICRTKLAILSAEEEMERLAYNRAQLFWSARAYDSLTSSCSSTSSSSSEDEDDPVPLNTRDGTQKMFMGGRIGDRTSFSTVRAYRRDEECVVQMEEARQESDLEHPTAHVQGLIEGQSSEAQMGSKNLQGVCTCGDERSVGANLLGEEQVRDVSRRVDVSQDLAPAGESLPSQASSHVFLPRGFSSGPSYIYRTQSMRTRSSHTLAGLSGDPSHQLFSQRSSMRTRSSHAQAGLSSDPSHQLFSQRSSMRTRSSHAQAGLSSDPSNQLFSQCSSVRTRSSHAQAGLSSDPSHQLFSQCSSVRTRSSHAQAGLSSDPSHQLFSQRSSMRTRSSHAQAGLSSDPSHQLFSQRSSVRNLRAQLSTASSLGYQTDQVPELEMDWYYPDSA